MDNSKIEHSSLNGVGRTTFYQGTSSEILYGVTIFEVHFTMYKSKSLKFPTSYLSQRHNQHLANFKQRKPKSAIIV